MGAQRAAGRFGRLFGVSMLFSSIFFGLVTATIVQAAAITVNDTSDTIHGCSTSGSGACSLRDAIVYGNAHAGTAISVPAGNYTLTIRPTDDPLKPTNASAGSLKIFANMTITGAGAGTTAIQASATNADAGIDRVLYVKGATVTISGMTIRNGLIEKSAGGGIRNDGGTLTLNDSVVSGNRSNCGGGISNGGGTTTINNSAVSNNSAKYGGGLCDDLSGNFNITGSTISGNIANGADPHGSFQGLGGGIIHFSGNEVIADSTISGNTSIDQAGALWMYGRQKLEVTLTNATVADNSSGIDGNDTSGVKVINTILANKTLNCAGTIVTGNYNLSSDDSCASSLSGSHDMNSTDPKLGPLASNGGPTQTQALLAGSPAIDTIPAQGANCPATDQRGVKRPQGSACDIGAFEAGGSPSTTGSQPTSTPTQQSGLSLTISCSFNGLVRVPGEAVLQLHVTQDGKPLSGAGIMRDGNLVNNQQNISFTDDKGNFSTFFDQDDTPQEKSFSPTFTASYPFPPSASAPVSFPYTVTKVRSAKTYTLNAKSAVALIIFRALPRPDLKEAAQDVGGKIIDRIPTLGKALGSVFGFATTFASFALPDKEWTPQEGDDIFRDIYRYQPTDSSNCPPLYRYVFRVGRSPDVGKQDNIIYSASLWTKNQSIANIDMNSNTIFSFMHSPATLYLTDPQGRHVGADPATGAVISELPDSIYTGPGTEPQVLAVFGPDSGSYTITATGTGTGQVQFDSGVSTSTDVVQYESTAVAVTPGQTLTHTITYVAEPPDTGGVATTTPLPGAPKTGGGGGVLYIRRLGDG